MDVGTTLRIARERRNLTIAQLASTTKIPATVLQAIDDNAFDRVPGGIFVRGFIRTYAREVGLDPEEMVTQFRAETAEPIPAVVGDGTAVEVLDDDIGHLPSEPDVSGSRPGWGYALIVAALVVGIVSFNRSNDADPQPAVAPAVAEAAAEPDAIDAGARELNAIATTGGGLHFEIQASGECWIRVVADGKTIIQRLLLPGERITADAQHDVVLRVGDPAALTYSLNGRPGGALGAAGTPVTVRFTSDGRQVPPVS